MPAKEHGQLGEAHVGNQWVAQLAEARDLADDLARRLAAETARADGLHEQIRTGEIRIGELEIELRALRDDHDTGLLAKQPA